MSRRSDDGWIPTLSEALSNRMNAEELQVLARLTKPPAPKRKAELAEHILAHLAGDRLRAVWQSLDDLQKAAVAEAVHSGEPTFQASRFLAKYGRMPDFGTLSPRSAKGHATPLLFFFYGMMDRVMPDDLMARLSVFVPAPAMPEVKSLDQLPEACPLPIDSGSVSPGGTKSAPLVARESERAASRELIAVLRLVDAGGVAVGDATRRPSSASVAAVAAVLEGGDYYPHQAPKDRWFDENAGPIRAFAWPLILQAGGLAERAGSRLRLTKAGRSALSEPAAGTLKALWRKWVHTSMFDELARIECVKGQSGKGKRGLTAVSPRREAVASVLSACPARRWISTDEFLRFARASGHDLAVSRNPWSLYVGELQYGSLGTDGGEAVLDRRYAYCVLLEYAATLGLIDVALVPPAGARCDFGHLWGTDELPYFSRYDGLAFLRITALGGYCLDMAEAVPPEPAVAGPSLRVLPTLEIVAVGGDVGRADLLALDAYAVRVSDRVWRLEPDRLLTAAEAGRPVAEVREFLTSRNDGPLPETVARLLGDVGRRCACVHDRGLVRLVECEDDSMAALVANDSRTRRHCMRAGERHLIVRASSESAFRRGLRETGYLLAAEEGRGARSEGGEEKVGRVGDALRDANDPRLEV